MNLLRNHTRTSRIWNPLWEATRNGEAGGPFYDESIFPGVSEFTYTPAERVFGLNVTNSFISL